MQGGKPGGGASPTASSGGAASSGAASSGAASPLPGPRAEQPPTWSQGGFGLPPLKDWPSRPIEERRDMLRHVTERERAAKEAAKAARGATGIAAQGYAPTAEELVRWEAPTVAAYRRKVAPYLFVNGVLIAVSVISRNNFLPITAIWSIILAYQYAKLWSDGYDWRDVLRQPRDRMFGDVIADVGESIEATFSKKKREQLRAEGRTQSRLLDALSPRSPVPTAGTSGASRAPAGGYGPADFGRHGSIVDGARAAREEIARLLATLPAADRSQIPDVATTAIQLTQKVEELVVALAACDEALGARSLDAIDQEIATLEAAANPLEAGSETRVRRLAVLRRERRATLDLVARREEHVARLDACTLALENMRLDLVRLRTGGGTTQSVTQVAEAALAVARDVDRVVEAAQEVRGLTASRSGRA
jgi:serine/threonine-protein kinase